MPNILRNIKVKEVSSVRVGAGEDVKVLLMKNLEGNVGKKLTFQHKDGKTQLWHEPDTPTHMEPDADDTGDYADVTDDADGVGDDKVSVGKREFSDKQREKLADSGHALPDGSFPIVTEEDLHNAIRAIGRAKNPAKAKAHIKSRAKAMGMTDVLPDSWKSGGKVGKFASMVDTLRKSVESLFGGDAPPVAKEFLEKTFNEFTEDASHVVKQGDEGAITHAANGSDSINKGNEDMTDKEMKDLKDKQEAADKACKSAEAEVAKLKEELAFAKLSPEHQDYAKKLDEPLRKAWIGKAEAERNADVAKAVELAKAALPESVRKDLENISVMRKQLEEITKAQENEALAKRANEIGLGAQHIETLAKARKGDVEAVKKLEDTISALTKQVREAGLFREFGSNSGGAGSAYEQLQARAQDLRKNDAKLTPQQAFTKAYVDPANKDLVAQYKREQLSAN